MWCFGVLEIYSYDFSMNMKYERNDSAAMSCRPVKSIYQVNKKEKNSIKGLVLFIWCSKVNSCWNKTSPRAVMILINTKVRQCSAVVPSGVGDEAVEKEDDRGEEILLNVMRPDYERPAPPPPMEPLYSPREDGKVQGKPVYLTVMTHTIKIYRCTECLVE